MDKNMKWKKALPPAIFILVIIGIVLLVTLLSGNKIVPSITNKDANYVTVNEPTGQYSFSNDTVYQQLKRSYGLATVLGETDKHILKTKKNAGGIAYYDIPSEDEVKEEYLKAAGLVDLEEGTDKYNDAEQDYLDMMYLQGYKNSSGSNYELVLEFHRLGLAKKAYAKDMLIKEIDATNEAAKNDTSVKPHHSLNDYTSYYDANYKDGFYAIVIPFSSEEEVNIALAQLGIQIGETGTSVVYKQWQWNSDTLTTKKGTALTVAEITRAFIQLYNTVNASKLATYPGLDVDDRLTLKEGLQYEYKDLKYSFNTELVKDEEGEIDYDDPLNELYFSYDQLNNINSSLRNYIEYTMTDYKDDAVIINPKWYTPEPRSYSSGAIQALMLKILTVKKESLWTNENVNNEINDIKPEFRALIFEKLLETELAQYFIDDKFNELRTEFNVTFFDKELESAYKSSYYDFKTTKKTDKEKVASIDGLTITADDLFILLDSKYGGIVAISELVYERFLSLDELNDIYNYTGDASKVDNKKILDPEEWKNLKLQVIYEKRNFASNAYAQYGYPATYGWKRFLKDVYGVDGDVELVFYFLYSNINAKQIQKFSDLSKVDEDSELWKQYLTLMQKIIDEYFSVGGEHMLITVYDAKGDVKDPTEWTNYQRQLATQFYEEILEYMTNMPGTYASKLQNITSAYKTAPYYLAHLDQDLDSQPAVIMKEGEEPTKDVYMLFYNVGGYRKSIDLAKYRSAGLSIKYENLGTFSNGAMVSEFNDAAKFLYGEIFNPNSPFYGRDELVFTPAMASLANIESEDYNSKFDEDSGEYNYLDQSNWLITQFGYHIYINLQAFDINKWQDEDDNKFILPTLLMIKTHMYDSSAQFLFELDENGEIKLNEDDEPIETEIAFTSEMKSAISTYYSVIYNEITGSSNIKKFIHEMILEVYLNGYMTFHNNNLTPDDFETYINMMIKQATDGLVYMKVEDEKE